MGQGWGEAKGPTPHESAQDRLRRAARAHVDADTPDTLRALSRALEDVERDGVVGNSLVGVPSRAGGSVVDAIAGFEPPPGTEGYTGQLPAPGSGPSFLLCTGEASGRCPAHPWEHREHFADVGRVVVDPTPPDALRPTE